MSEGITGIVCDICLQPRPAQALQFSRAWSLVEQKVFGGVIMICRKTAAGETQMAENAFVHTKCSKKHAVAIALAALAGLATVSATPALAQHSHATEALSIASPTHASAYAEGLYLLHNFEYGRAAAAFRQAQSEDPANVMAVWGEAMTYNHPLWAFQDRDKARAVLARLGPDAAARLAKARTPRERNWLEALETLYGEGDKRSRDRQYHANMMELHRADPADIEARTFAALATLGLASEGRDIPTYMTAAALLEEGFDDHPAHPGILHYLIHSYDDPAHAPLGLRAARRYAVIAPDAGHAQHMISHIYHALGDWAAVERANLRATAVVNTQRAAAGRPPLWCGHNNEWLAYALDQQGKDAETLLDKCRAQAMADLARGDDKTVLGSGEGPFNSWAVIAVRHGVDTGRWPSPAALPPGEHKLIGRFHLTYGQLLASRDKPAAAADALAKLRRERAVIAKAMPQESPDEYEIPAWLDRAVAQGEAVVALASGRTERGLQLLKSAAAAEAALPRTYGPPLLAKPSAELLADEYLASGRKADAAAAYRTVLEMMPRRRLSLIGLEQAK